MKCNLFGMRMVCEASKGIYAAKLFAHPVCLCFWVVF